MSIRKTECTLVSTGAEEINLNEHRKARVNLSEHEGLGVNLSEHTQTEVNLMEHVKTQKPEWILKMMNVKSKME